MKTTIFLHGLESSGHGTKGSYLAKYFPEVLCPNFFGTLEERINQLTVLCRDSNELTLIGSSFGGLMATCYAIAHTKAVDRLILLAPALNFPEYTSPVRMLDVPTLLVIGRQDTVTPPARVLPKAEKTFTDLEVMLVDDDHMLHSTFKTLQWHKLIRNC